MLRFLEFCIKKWTLKVNSMISILFTKKYAQTFLMQHFSQNFEVKSVSFIQTELVDLELIKNQIQPNTHNYIITSFRAAKHIQPIGLTGNFYCVGEKSAEILLQNPKNQVQTFDNGQDLVKNFQALNAEPITLNSELITHNFIYFCSNIRRDEIPYGLRNLGHQVQEIITYKTISQKVKMENDFDAYVFFSPSGVKSFQEQYAIPQKASIFAIGETTANAIEKAFNKKALTPEKPNIELLKKLIKTYFDA